MSDEKKESKGRKPDWTGDGVAVWVWDQGGEKERLSIKVVGHDYVIAWKPKQ